MEEPDRPKLHDVFSRLECASLMQEFLPAAPPVAREYRVAEAGDDVRELAAGDAPLALWVEPDLGASLSRKQGESLIVPLASNDGEVASAFRALLESHRLLI